MIKVYDATGAHTSDLGIEGYYVHKLVSFEGTVMVDTMNVDIACGQEKDVDPTWFQQQLLASLNAKGVVVKSFGVKYKGEDEDGFSVYTYSFAFIPVLEDVIVEMFDKSHEVKDIKVYYPLV